MNPALVLSHTKTSLLVEKGQLINRYWFRWSDRTDLRALVLRVELIDDEGNRVDSFSVKLPRTRFQIIKDPDDPAKEFRQYDTPIYVSIDGTPKAPTGFRYRTVTGLLKKSATAEARLDGGYEDLSMFN
ncbi:hypothetical protein [Arsenicibacter rosenii]|uniref:Uncharacterized protein n=1 Tax=Arsenicibacter rosenii TaxID=1750698 RepID=A0A1S2VCT0_9BACT|nr:hypothetical protein [Arsenicibacter rosenii]OIN55738.1 hypothetical protein BLX24_28395 [Arsenicibacter rosenii]